MILQALVDYYQRKVAAEPGSLPGPGWDKVELHFLLVLDLEGQLKGIEDLRSGEDRSKRGRVSFVPRVPEKLKATSNIAANLLWDKPSYVFGYEADPSKAASGSDGARKQKKQGKQKNPARLDEQRKAFIETIRKRAPGREPPVRAVLRFLEGNPLEQAQQHSRWVDIERAAGANLGFRIEGTQGFVFDLPGVREGLKLDAKEKGKEAQCLITGEESPVAELHPPIKGIRGAQSTGGSIVSFNLPAFCSYKKTQGFNSPVSEAAAFAYTGALNHLLGRDSRQKFTVGDATAVAWGQNDTTLAQELGSLFDEFADDPDGNIGTLQALYAAPRTGSEPILNDPTEFYVLGLSPNAARLSVRFWYPTTVREIAGNILRWFEDIRLDGPEWVTHAPAVHRLFRALAVQGKADNIPPNLAGEVTRAILEGRPYPLSLLQAAIGRCRAEQEVNFERAALTKAVLRRNFNDGGINMSLNKDNQNPAYRLGRLFAVLEKAQEEANPGTNTTIRERYYGAGSTTPGSVLPILMRLKNHHLAKLGPGRRINLERLIGEIHQGIEDYPAHLSLADQGRFAIGYYHQRQAFYTKSDAPEPADTEKTTEETP